MFLPPPLCDPHPPTSYFYYKRAEICPVIVNDISDRLSSNTTMGNQQSGAGGGGGKDKVKICSAIFPEKLPGLKVI